MVGLHEDVMKKKEVHAKVRLEFFNNFLLHDYCSYIYLTKFQFCEFFWS
jgi:hypothetical protein